MNALMFGLVTVILLVLLQIEKKQDRAIHDLRTKVEKLENPVTSEFGKNIYGDHVITDYKFRNNLIQRGEKK